MYAGGGEDWTGLDFGRNRGVAEAILKPFEGQSSAIEPPPAPDDESPGEPNIRPQAPLPWER